MLIALVPLVLLSLQFGLGLRLLQNGFHLGRLHDVALDLELPRHEKPLRVGLARDQLAEILVRERKGNYCRQMRTVSLFSTSIAQHRPVSTSLTRGLGSRPRADGALLLKVDVPALGLPGLVLQGEGEYGIPLFNGVFTVGLAGLKHGVDGLKCFGGRKLVCGKQGLVVRVSQSEQGINSLFAYREMRQDCLPFLSPMMPDCDIKMP